MINSILLYKNEFKLKFFYIGKFGHSISILKTISKLDKNIK